MAGHPLYRQAFMILQNKDPRRKGLMRAIGVQIGGKIAAWCLYLG